VDLLEAVYSALHRVRRWIPLRDRTLIGIGVALVLLYAFSLGGSKRTYR
jgi:hypothetical protein